MSLVFGCLSNYTEIVWQVYSNHIPNKHIFIITTLDKKNDIKST